MAVYLCQCNLVVSTVGEKTNCPRCGRALQACERLFFGNAADGLERRAVGGTAETAAPAESSGGKQIRRLSGFFSAIAHIRSEQDINYSGSPSS